ncbi:ribosome recycling factor [Candidatus Kaiserbacteria bacterium RIFCSPHIGHO2_01_FULL_49_13]|uniref:Ribosome recycling factor n=1 Tax=Candidatus Kaiserbacteria bacterium RIFCSPHIGHO2_01_FULL_49_13 TaxID=1798477 RepID=A0A1F6CCU0_9BACT|nr:MAG: ribosome recycling factor [Candidatus Kaiserbacteria bacterium RIFCSPHIGHO2_01_FULL_49_13]
MAYNFAPLKQKITDTENWLKKEFQGIRTGRATPTLLDSVSVDSYGAKLPVSQVSAITTEDARTLRITPWDRSQAKAIEKAIAQSNLGISVALDDQGVRVMFPELTAERRAQLMKIVKERLEHAKVALRAERDKIWSDIQAQEKKSAISKDEKFRYKEEMEKIIAEGNKRLEEASRRKDLEISQ